MSALKPSGRTVDPGGVFAPAGPTPRRPLSFRILAFAFLVAGFVVGLVTWGGR